MVARCRPPEIVGSSMNGRIPHPRATHGLSTNRPRTHGTLDWGLG
ncbi:MAG: hypothetical protein ACXWPS_11700 [Ktedonobacteraceae bacterium]